MPVSLEERKLVEKKLKRIYFLFVIGLMVSLIAALMVIMLLQSIEALIQLPLKKTFFRDGWLYMLTLIVFLVVFTYWITAFRLLTELRRFRKIKSKLVE